MALTILLGADALTALVVVNSITRSGGHGGVFWAAVGLLAALLVGLLWLTYRVGRATFAKRIVKPS